MSWQFLNSEQFGKNNGDNHRCISLMLKLWARRGVALFPPTAVFNHCITIYRPPMAGNCAMASLLKRESAAQ